MALTPQVADAVSIPVIAAGGVADSRGVAAAFALGADGVQIGTRFLAAKECVVHDNYKQAVLSAKDIDTVVTGQITGHPVRCLRNKLTRGFEELENELMKQDKPDITRFEAFGAGSLKRAAVDGDRENGSLMCGQIAGLVTKEQTCAEIIEELMAGLFGVIEGVSRRVSLK
jgi:enoyl-[acyl-carrier protein] reductase II